MLIILILIITVGIVGAVAFLHINKDQKPEDKNEAGDYEIKEID